MVVKRELRLKDDDKTIGIIGMLHENKGHRYFIEAASFLSSRKPEARFLIIGDGELREELKRQVNELGLDNTVLFLGHQENMPEIYSFLDIFVIASDSETFGLSLLEAMAAKKAIITTDCGGPSEIIQNGRNGIIVPIRDPKTMAEKIEYLLDNSAQSEFLSGNAQKDVEKYDISFTVRKIQQIYEETAIR
jgi:glycosyltransferase involved in cell wall biosynthesis